MSDWQAIIAMHSEEWPSAVFTVLGFMMVFAGVWTGCP